MRTTIALAIALLSPPIVAFQSPPPAASIRDVASSASFTLVVKADGSLGMTFFEPGSLKLVGEA